MPSPAPEPLSPRPLTIWLVNPSDDIPGEDSGASRTLSLARVLSARGHDVTWWSSTWSHARKTTRHVQATLREDEGFAVRLVAVRAYDRDVSLARLASRRDFGRTLERLVAETIASGQMRRPDLIVATVPPLAGAEACVRLARRLDTTLVVDLPELWPETRAALLPGPASLRRLLAPWLLRGMCRRRDAVLAAADGISAAASAELAAILPPVAPAVRAGLAGVGADASPAEPASGRAVPSHVCPVGAYLQEFTAARPHVEPVPLPGAAAATTNPRRPVQCVHVCSGGTERDLESLVRVARLLGNRGVEAIMHVVVTDTGRAAIERVADRLRGSCRLVVHRRPERRAYVELLGGCDVGLVGLSRDRRAAVPVEVCEYAAAGLAIVSGLPGDLAILVDRHGAGATCPPDDPAAWADTIAALAADRRRLAGHRDGARRLAAAAFDRESTSTRFAAWLEAVAAGVSDPFV